MPSIYIADNYKTCRLHYRVWRRLVQFCARVFPPDWVYIVWVQEHGDLADVWIGGIYLHLDDAKREIARFMRQHPQGWAEWEQRGLR